MMATLSSREFNQQLNLAKKAAQDGPVIITDRGKPAHVLLSFDAYQALSGNRQKVADLLAMPEPFDLELPLAGELPRPAKLS